MADDPGSDHDRVTTWVEEQQYLAGPFPIAPESDMPAAMSEAAADPVGIGLATVSRSRITSKRMEAAHAAAQFAQTAEAFAGAIDSEDETEAREVRKDHAQAQRNLKKLVMQLSDLDDTEIENAPAGDLPPLDLAQFQDGESEVPKLLSDVHETDYNVENLFGLQVWYHGPSKTFWYLSKKYLRPLGEDFYKRHQTRLDLLRVGVIELEYKMGYINGYQVTYDRDEGTFSRNNGDGEESVTSDFALEHEAEMNALAALSKPLASSSKKRRIEVVTDTTNGRSPKRVTRSVYEDSDMSLLDEDLR